MIGIDLGTTNSLVAVMDEGGPRVLANELGEDLTPSAIAVAEDGTLLVGRAAKDRLVTAPQSGRAFFKRDMGTSATYGFGGRRWTPVECSAAVLREMKRIAELRLGKQVDTAVITVPAYFHDQQRQATVEAAKIAGLRVERLVNEPTAAALAYGYDARDDLSTLMVFDLGGGTFDVTVLECFDGVVEVKASSGESRLGGEDFTDALAAWLTKEFGWKPEATQAGRWREQVELLKRRLTKDERSAIAIAGKEAPISRSDFRSATAELTARLRPVVHRALRDAQITSAQLDAVLMVGGASRMPIVVEHLVEDLKLTPDTRLDPDRVVALGAAIQQALCAGNAAVRELVLTDVCPHTLGVDISKQLAPGKIEPGFFSPILDRNTTVPTSRSEIFNTLHPDQDEILLKVYQGESRMVRDNQLIGHVRVNGLRTRPGQSHPGQIDVRFSYDMNGILEVEVTILSTSRKVTAVIEQRPGTMTPDQIADAIRALQPLKIHPREMPANRARLERAGRLYADVSGDLRVALSNLLDRFESALASQDPGMIASAAEELDSFMHPFFREEI
ncbi:MAG: Hsp70 family protein [Verrucomicrobiaceae bacterium]|nr:Hsp70 family protein [Verrucomicrobiaceae bacterium]